MSAPAGKQPAFPQAAWPTVSYFDEFYKLPAYFNGEAVITVYHAPAANTDGDSIVHFRRSEVISAGDIFSTVSYPMIDLTKGGSVHGVIDGLNKILDLAFAEDRSQGGTWIVPSARTAIRYRRRGLVPEYGRDDPRPGSGPDRQGHDARAGESGAPLDRLRRALRLDNGSLDDRRCSSRRCIEAYQESEK